MQINYKLKNLEKNLNKKPMVWIKNFRNNKEKFPKKNFIS